jgi:hypothetical protein
MASIKKLSDFNTYDFSNIDPTTYLVGVVANRDNLNINSQSFYTTFETKDDANLTHTQLSSQINTLNTAITNTATTIHNELTAVSSYLQTEIDNIPGGGSDCIKWIMDGQQPYTNTLDALNNNKLPVYKVSNPSGATYAYFKDVTTDGIRFYTLMDDNTTFTEYLVKHDNSVEETELQNVDSVVIYRSNESDIYNKVKDAVNNGQSVKVISAQNTMKFYMDMIAMNNINYYFNIISLDGNNYIRTLTNNGWQI